MPVKLDVDVLKLARIVASYEETTIVELISEILRPILQQRLEKHAAEQLRHKPDKKERS